MHHACFDQYFSCNGINVTNYLVLWCSYPNLIPLPVAEVRRMAALCKNLHFEAIYGMLESSVVHTLGNQTVQQSAKRYISALEGAYHTGKYV